MKRMLIGVMAAVCWISCAWSATGFLRVKGHDIVDAKGEKFFIRGTNLGNWLNPEGYMFGFKSCSSGHFIDEMFKQLVGPEETAKFWRAFKDAYITEADIAFVAKTGSNTIRLPFHYKLFTDEDYLGLTGPGDGFKRVDDVVGWCRKYNLKLILDMHDCPGGQTGDNIDDSYGYPWLFESEAFQKRYCDIWRMIAKRYADTFSERYARGEGLYIEGTNGTGKTHLAAAIALQLLNEGIPVICKTSSDMFTDIKKAYDGGDMSEAQILDIYKSADLLIIDDLGKEQCSDWSMTTLYSIVNDRYEDMKPIIVTTNYGAEDLIRVLTPRGYDSGKIVAIISRLRETSTAITMAWADYRSQ